MSTRRSDASSRFSWMIWRTICSCALEREVLELVDAVFEVLDRRTIVVDHRVDDAVKQPDRTFAQDPLVLIAHLPQAPDAARLPVVDGTR